jgi:sarcosine oxidase delta subunit
MDREEFETRFSGDAQEADPYPDTQSNDDGPTYTYARRNVKTSDGLESAH